MKLLEQYQKFNDLYRSNYIFDPETFTFYSDDPESFSKPIGFEEWKVEKLDVKEYGQKRLLELGLTEKDNEIELFEIGSKKKKTKEPIFSINRFGDIEIIQYWLNRHPLFKDVNPGEKNGKGLATGERFVWHTRHHPWREKLTGAKYDTTKGDNHPFFPPSLVNSFEKGTQIDTITITEGHFKAMKATMSGIPTIGLTSITHYRNKKKELHSDIILFIRRCQVKNVVILWDGDCRDVSTKAIAKGDDLATRPRIFYNGILKIRTYLKEIFVQKDFKVYFATINSEDIQTNPKGLDDLFINLKDEHGDILRAYSDIGSPSKYFNFCLVNNELGEKKLNRWFNLNSVKDFYDFHKDKIKGQNFVWFGSTYRLEKDLPVVEVSASIKQYKRIGPDYFRLVTSKRYNDDGEEIGEEVDLTPWKFSAITSDYGKGVDKYIERLDSFTNVASHTNYQPIIDNKWNLYQDIKHQISEGEWNTTREFLQHIFEEQYEIALDYITLLYKKPSQKLPVLCLVSKEEGTGKSTFIQFLHLIFQSNMAIVASEDIVGSWTSHWVSKLIVASEETFFEKKEALERIKNYSTAELVMRSERFVNQKMIPCIMKFVFCSNHEDDFIRLNSNSSRFWVRKVKPIPQNKMNTELKQLLVQELPAFLHFIVNREIVHPKKDRMWFEKSILVTDAFKNVVRNSEPGHIKELRIKLENYFVKWGVEKVLLTAENIQTNFNIRAESSYLNRIIKEHLKAKRVESPSGKKDYVATYEFYKDDPNDGTKFIVVKDKGRPFVFHRSDFVGEGLFKDVDPVQTKMELESVEETKNDDLPF